MTYLMAQTFLDRKVTRRNIILSELPFVKVLSFRQKVQYQNSSVFDIFSSSKYCRH